MKKSVRLLKRYLSVLLLMIGAGMMAFGILGREEHLIVLNKAIKICMECIGLG